MQTGELITQTHGRYWHKLGRALGNGTLALCFSLLIGASWSARLGTASGRGVACLLLALAVGWVVFSRLRWGKRSARPERVFRGIVRQVDPVLSRKLLSAATLAARGESEHRHLSVELAQLHFARLLAKIPLARIEERGGRIASWVNVAALCVSLLTLLAVLVDPFRVPEGLNVLFAHNGRAPLRTTWLDLETLTAQAPAYLRRPSAAVELDAPVQLPKGSQLTLRGLGRFEGRRVILTDGKAEIPFVSDGAGGLLARFELTRSTRLELAVRFGNVLVVQSPALEIAALNDEAPHVVLEQAPKRFAMADLSELVLRYRARDDHGLRQLELTLRSGSRQEQRKLVQLDGEQRQYEGAHVLGMDDPFIAQSAGSITLTVSARDDNAVDGPRHGTSEAIVLEPPSLGSAQKERYQALGRLRDALVDWFALIRHDRSLAASKAHFEQRVRPAERLFLDLVGSKGRANTMIRGYLRGQSEKLEPARLRGPAGDKTLIEAILAVDALMATLGQRDAEQLSRQLARVAEEIEFAARAARGSEGREQAMRSLNDGQDRLRLGASMLGHLGVLGADLGQVAAAGALRIRRAVEASDLVNAERAASFLAERLDRPVPSFLGGGRPGVESGTSRAPGPSRGDERGRPSEADTRFERLANELRQLTEEHATATDTTGQLVDKMAQMVESASTLPDAAARVEALRQVVASLPDLGGEPGTVQASLALAKELTRGAAESLSRYELGPTLEGLRQAEGTLTEAEQLSRATLWGSEEQQQAWQRAKEQISRQRRWAEAKLAEHRHDAARPSMEALRNLAPTERALMERAKAIVAREAKNDHVLPEDYRDRLEQAARLMNQAASELSIARGPAAFERQRAAQSLLEQLEVGAVSDSGQSEAAARSGGNAGRGMAREGSVTSTSDVEARERFRRRVLDGLSRGQSADGAAQVRRYAEGLLR